MRRGVDMRGRRAGGESVLTEITYSASGFSDADYYAGAAGALLGPSRSVAFCFRLASLPGAGRKCIVSRVGGQSEYEISVSVSVANRLSVIHYSDTAPNYVTVDLLDFVAGDVGKLFLVHATTGTGSGARVKVYVQGALVNYGDCPGLPNAANAATPTVIGKWGAGAGYGAGSWCQAISLRVSSGEMTPLQVTVDAESVMGRTSRLTFPTLPSENGRWVAASLVGSPATWLDRTGSDPLTKNGAPTLAALDPSSTWAKALGIVTLTGDSTGVGLNGGTGGWRPGLATALTVAGYRHTESGSVAGPGGAHFAYSATFISDFLAAGAHPLAAELVLRSSSLCVLSQVFNDWRFGDGLGGPVSQATVRARMEALLDELFAAAPHLRVVLPPCLSVRPGDIAAWPNADQPACDAAVSVWNATTGPALAADQRALGRRVIFADPYSGDPVRDDYIHPVDGATGYDLMYPPIVAAIQSLKAA